MTDNTPIKENVNEVETLRELLHECQKHVAAVALMMQNVNKWNQVMYYKLQEVLKDGKD